MVKILIKRFPKFQINSKGIEKNNKTTKPELYREIKVVKAITRVVRIGTFQPLSHCQTTGSRRKLGHLTNKQKGKFRKFYSKLNTKEKKLNH